MQKHLRHNTDIQLQTKYLVYVDISCVLWSLSVHEGNCAVGPQEVTEAVGAIGVAPEQLLSNF